MNEIKIVKYDHSYAESVADMWKKSVDNWGGELVMNTAEEVIDDYEKSSNICAFLAVDEEEVVGYCGFSQYHHDEGAAYIPLLNVRTDHIGKKIGKTLVKECVEMAINSKWPRLDLYTWQGNDKAVPVYKKCGFFWEDRDDTTHLMNFIPYVMRTEAVKEYFNTMDWYDDNVREIKIESDGRCKGDFEYYEYIWEKDDTTLKMDFERYGRGLTCIETDDYIIKARVDNKELITGRDYEVRYECINKSSKELDIKIKGIKDKNITNSVLYEGLVEDKEIISGKFYIDTNYEQQDKYRSYPCVAAIITINGKEAMFKIGIYCNNPIKMTIANTEEHRYLHKTNECYMDITNNYLEDINISFSMKNKEWISFNDQQLKYTLKAREKKSISIPFILTDYNFYDEEIIVTINNSSCETKYNARICGAFRGVTGAFHGEDDEYYCINNGNYTVKMDKKSNLIMFREAKSKGKEIFIRVPQIGKPYTIELANKKAHKVLLESIEDRERINATYILNQYKQIKLNYLIDLYANGIVKIYGELTNLSENTTYDKIFYSSKIHYTINNGILPINNNIVRSPYQEECDAMRWDHEKLSENWIFNENDKMGIGWSKSSKIKFSDFFINVDYEINNLSLGETYITEPIILTINTFDSWYDFRKYMDNADININNIKQTFECSINKGNSFIDDNIELTFEEYKSEPVEGSVTVSSKYDLFDTVNKELEFVNNKALINWRLNNKKELDILEIKADLDSKLINRERVIFFKDNKEVVLEEYIDQDKTVYEANNGVIQIKSSPQFSQGIYSLKYKDEEWLDNSFPEACVKSWWNYWTGGYSFVNSELSFASIYKEKKKAEFVDLIDNYGNQWSGIKSSIDIMENEKYKGISIDQYFLLLTSVPVLCEFAIIHQNNNKYFQNRRFERLAFFKHSEDIKNNWILTKDRGEDIIHKYTNTILNLNADKYLTHGSNKSDYRLIHLASNIIAHNTNGISMEISKDYITTGNNTSITTKPSFMVFSKDNLNDGMLENLYKISFDI